MRPIELKAERHDAISPSESQIDARFHLNQALPLSEITDFYAVEERYPPFTPYAVCGNKDDPNTCECVPGE